MTYSQSQAGAHIDSTLQRASASSFPFQTVLFTRNLDCFAKNEGERWSRAIRQEAGLPHVGIYRLTYSLEHRLPYLTNRLGSAINEVFSRDLAKNNLTIAHWRVLTVLHHAGNQTLIDLSIHTSIGPSILSRLTEGMQRRRLVARNMLRLMYQRIVASRNFDPENHQPIHVRINQ